LRLLSPLRVAAFTLTTMFVLSTPASAQLGEPDLSVMLALRDQYGWGEVFNWAIPNPCPGNDSWFGVTCAGGRVDILSVRCTTKRLSQPIPPIIAQLTALTTLDIRDCGMTGSVDVPATLPTLTRIRLDGNSLTGPVPPIFGTFPSLGILNLEANRLTGPVPRFRDTTSSVIRLSGNYLNAIPPEWSTFNRHINYNCHPSFPASCDTETNSNRCRPNRQDCPGELVLSKISGDAQRTPVNTVFAIPFVVSVTNLSGAPVTGVVVSFSGSGVLATSAMSDANGQASASVQANSVAGGHTVTASLTPTVMTTFGVTNSATTTCSPSISVTSNGDSGPDTLRQALADVCSGGTVDLSAIAGQTIALSSGLTDYNFGGRLYIANDVTIQGSGVSINGSGTTRIFFVQGGNVTLRNLTLTNGLGQGGSSQWGGSAAGMGGAIFQNGGTLTLSSVVVSGNRAMGGSPDSSGARRGGGFGANGSGGDLGGLAGAGDGAGGIEDGYGGAGGFGGGGGTGTQAFMVGYIGGTGGFGAGAGIGVDNFTPSRVVSNVPGYGGGWGTLNTNGGPGAGFGGAIFVRSGTLNLAGVTFSGNTALAGAGGPLNAAAQGKGGALFLYSGAILNVAPGVVFAANVAADAGAESLGFSGAPYQNRAKCPGVDTVDICGVVPTNKLTVSVSGNGSVVDNGGLIHCPSENCSAMYLNSAVLTAAAIGGNAFAGWSGACSGTGTCTVSLAGGNAAVAANFVPSAPAITLHPSNATVKTGSIASFMATAVGAPTVQWQMSTNGGVTFTDIKGATTTTYSFRAAMPQDGYRYRAMFSNSGGSTPTTAATLRVDNPGRSPHVWATSEQR
jgi:hypothetical protein